MPPKARKRCNCEPMDNLLLKGIVVEQAEQLEQLRRQRDNLIYRCKRQSDAIVLLTRAVERAKDAEWEARSKEVS